MQDLSGTRDGGFEVAEKRKRKEGIGRGREGVGGRQGVVGGRGGIALGGRGGRRSIGVEGGRSANTSVTNIKQKMRTMINVLESDEPEGEYGGDGGTNEHEVYNSNVNEKGQFQETEEEERNHMYNSNKHPVQYKQHISTRPSESRSPVPHPASEMYPHVLVRERKERKERREKGREGRGEERRETREGNISLIILKERIFYDGRTNYAEEELRISVEGIRSC